MNALIVGASAGLGREIAVGLARKGWSLLLTASDQTDLQALAADLSIRFGTHVETFAFDLRVSPTAEFLANVSAGFETLDAVFIVAGRADVGDTGFNDDATIRDLFYVNALTPIRIVNALMPLMAQNPRGRLIGIGSVAAVRPRSVNVMYGAAKRALEHYFLALRHHLADLPCRVQFYRVGYMDTAMMRGRRALLPRANPCRVANLIINRMDGPEGLSVVPWWWQPVLALYVAMPWFIFRRLRF